MSKRAKLNTIRIIGGQWRGRRVPVIDSKGLRPTIDRVRETLFNWLMHDINGARCLDLFAGSGALGIESLSRGAKYVQFIESEPKAANQIKENLALLLGNDRSQSVSVACLNALKVINKPPEKPYNIVFLDPPFESELLDQSLAVLEENGYLADGAMIYLEQDIDAPNVIVSSRWKLHRQGVAGQSAYFLYIS